MENDKNWFLDRNSAGLLVVDVQERLFPLVEHPEEVLKEIEKMVRGANVLKLPVFVSEQYPEKMGKTLSHLNGLLEGNQHLSKTSFSCLKDKEIEAILKNSSVTQWILVGIEAHVCILQTAKDLIKNHYKVAVLNNAISSRSIYDYSTAIAEMRDIGVRITSVETALFELMGNSKIPEFKEISSLIK